MSSGFIPNDQNLVYAREEAKEFRGETTMNDISWFDNQFWLNWRLVTVRFRKDNQELRFTYANNLAWDALVLGKTSFPNGSAFGKVAYVVQEDKLFPSSLAPLGSRRYQIMVRDEKRYKDTDGWGYALFNSRGETFPENPKQAALACAACHRLAQARGYVFSQLMPQNNDSTSSKIAPKTLAAPSLSVHFGDKKAAELPENLLRFLPSPLPSTISLVSRGSVFHEVSAGTLDEVRPLLIQEVKARRRPAAIIDDEKKIFSAIWSAPTPECSSGQSGFAGLISYPPQQKNSHVFKFDHFCN